MRIKKTLANESPIPECESGQPDLVSNLELQKKEEGGGGLRKGVALRDRVPIPEKLAYASGQFANMLMSTININLTLPVFVVTLGVSPALIGFLEMVYRVWDAITDMIMGWVSDNTRTRWGRRRPYIFAGAFICALWMPVIWLLDRTWSMTTIVLWMIIGQLVMFACTTIWNIPYQCLLLEISPSSVERTNVAAIRGYFSKFAGLVIGWLWFLAQLPVFRGPNGEVDIIKGAFGVTCVAAILVILLGLLPAIFCKERYYKTAAIQEKVPLLKNIKLTFKNRPFLFLSSLTLLFTLGTLSVEKLAFFVRLYYVCGGDQELAAKLTGIIATVVTIVGIAAIPLFQWIARRFGKRAALVIVMCLFFCSSLSTLITYRPGMPYLTLINGALTAIAMTAIWVLLPSMTGDVVDHDELETGERREGAFAAIFSWMFKFAYSVALALSGLLVAWAGYDTKLESGQVEGVLFTIRMLLAIVPAVFIGTAIIITLRYPLTTQRIGEIRTLLEARRGRI
ncbi:MFS transporter [Opitutaceae bacterium TAV4]|nr:MFS transporter [Opitutaceae bacterium TAV4]RRK02281.1 MFS transporter [Opitutaceae bacterium TAV3]